MNADLFITPERFKQFQSLSENVHALSHQLPGSDAVLIMQFIVFYQRQMAAAPARFRKLQTMLAKHHPHLFCMNTLRVLVKDDEVDMLLEPASTAALMILQSETTANGKLKSPKAQLHPIS